MHRPQALFTLGSLRAILAVTLTAPVATINPPNKYTRTAQERFDKRKKSLSRSKYKPHQGAKECARRLKQFYS